MYLYFVGKSDAFYNICLILTIKVIENAIFKLTFDFNVIKTNKNVDYFISFFVSERYSSCRINLGHVAQKDLKLCQL